MGGSVAGPPVSENHAGLLRAQRTEEPAPPPPPAGPPSTSPAPLLHSLFQGPRFMTSEYNSKYLKEPSHQPGRQTRVGALATVPPHIPTPNPWGGDPWGPQSWYNTTKASAGNRRTHRQLGETTFPSLTSVL